MPTPPSMTGLQRLQSENITEGSGMAKYRYSPATPLIMAFDGDDLVCEKTSKIVILGGIHKTESETEPEIVITVDWEGNEAFHVKIAVETDIVYRWAMKNKSIVGMVGGQNEGTTIDYDEQFILK
jgi:hypothetical protein